MSNSYETSEKSGLSAKRFTRVVLGLFVLLIALTMLTAPSFAGSFPGQPPTSAPVSTPPIEATSTQGAATNATTKLSLLFPMPSLIISGVAVDFLQSARANVVKQAGIKCIRADVMFTPTFETTYSEANVTGICIIGILDWSLFGDGSLDHPTPFTVNDWGDAVSRAQEAYPGIHVWEIWNEPTLQQYQVGYMDGSPQHYFILLQSAFKILKTKDPSVQILGLGGAQLGHSYDIQFAKDVFALGGGAYMDAISIHAYPYQLNLGVTWDYYAGLWHDELQQYKALGKPFWVTETGLKSGQRAESDQTDYLIKSQSFFRQEGASAYVWYMLNDYSTGSYGLLNPNNTPKSSYYAFASLDS